MRAIGWIVAPVIAASALGASGFLRSLEDTTASSIALAEASEQAPRTTREAAAEVKDLPAIAGFTKRQADAFTALADALDLSAERVENLNDALGGQVTGLAGLRDRIASVTDPIGCIQTRLGELTRTSSEVPDRLGAITATLRGLIEAQDKAIRHLKSINRKLTALGAVATATDVEPPPPPPDAPSPDPGASPGPVDC